MNTILLSAGVVALMAAVIGGGLKAFNIELPVLRSRGVRAALGVLGVAFLSTAVLLREDNSNASDRDNASYQRQVVATCKAAQRINDRSVRTPSETYDRDAALAAGRANFKALRLRLERLPDRPAPKSLRDELNVARRRFDGYVREGRAFYKALARALPKEGTWEQLEATRLRLQHRGAGTIPDLEDALTRLAGQDCSLTSR